MASPGNQHCANCIGTLSFPTVGSLPNECIGLSAAIGIRNIKATAMLKRDTSLAVCSFPVANGELFSGFASYTFVKSLLDKFVFKSYAQRMVKQCHKIQK